MKPPTIYIAIADDQVLVRNGIVSLINSLNFGCEFMIEAGDGIELLDKIAHATHQPDLCLLDISMPRMDGYETMQQLHNRYPHIRCLALSNYNDELPVLRMMKNGAMGYITKTDLPEIMKKAILSVYRNEVFFSDELLKNCPRLLRIPLAELTDQILTDKELNLLKLCCTELTYEQIATQLYRSIRTIETDIQHLCHKLNVKGRHGLILYAVRAGFTPPRT